MAADVAAGLLAEPGPGGGAGVADKTQRVGSVAVVAPHPEHGRQQSQRKTLTHARTHTQASGKRLERVQDYRGGGEGEGGEGSPYYVQIPPLQLE